MATDDEQIWVGFYRFGLKSEATEAGTMDAVSTESRDRQASTVVSRKSR